MNRKRLVRVLVTTALASASVILVIEALKVGFKPYYQIDCNVGSNRTRMACQTQAALYIRQLPQYSIGTLTEPYLLLEVAQAFLVFIPVFLLSSVKVPSALIRKVALPTWLKVALGTGSLASAAVFLVYAVTDLQYTHALDWWPIIPLTLTFGGGGIILFGLYGFLAFASSSLLMVLAQLGLGLASAVRRTVVYLSVPLLLFLTGLIAAFDWNDMWSHATNFTGSLALGGSVTAKYGVSSTIQPYPPLSNMFLAVLGCLVFAFYLFRGISARRSPVGESDEDGNGTAEVFRILRQEKWARETRRAPRLHAWGRCST